jgi:hypothetical protein
LFSPKRRGAQQSLTLATVEHPGTIPDSNDVPPRETPSGAATPAELTLAAKGKRTGCQLIDFLP